MHTNIYKGPDKGFQTLFLPYSVGVGVCSFWAGSRRMDLMLPGSPYEPLSADHLHKPGSHQQTHCSLSDSQMHKLFHFRQSFFYQTSFEHKHWPKVTFSPRNWGRIGQGEVSKSLKQNQCRLREVIFNCCLKFFSQRLLRQNCPLIALCAFYFFPCKNRIVKNVDTESSKMLTQNRPKCWHRIVKNVDTESSEMLTQNRQKKLTQTS